MLFYILLITFLLFIMLIEQLISARSMKQTIPPSMTIAYVPASKGLLVAAVIVFLVMAIRFNIGWDYKAYYDTIRYNAETNIVSGQETATILLIELARHFNYVNLYFVVNAWIAISCVMLTIRRYSVHPWLSFFIFLCFPLFFLNSLSVIRFFTALAITFFSFNYIVQKKTLRFFILIVLASLFHKSALIAALFYAVRFIKLKLSTLIIVICTLPLVAPLLNQLVVTFLPKYAVYTEQTEVQEGTKAIVFLLIIAGFIILLKRQIEADETAVLYCQLFLVGIALYVMFYTQGTMGHRLSLYGTIYALLVVPKLLSLLPHALLRSTVTFCLYGLLIAMYLYTIYSGREAYIPYTTIFH